MPKNLIYSIGIETSCDETAASVVDSAYNIISNIIFSQQSLHASFFGVVPELASRTHYEKIHFVIDKALKKFDIKKINLIAYTEKPGLKGALLIGKTVAKTLGYLYSVPTVGVDHLWGHIYSVILTLKGSIKFPFLSLIISGGHTELSIVNSFTKREILGQTRDDAVGEAFDKVAKILHTYLDEKCKKQIPLFYPGGPVIEKLARYGDAKKIELPKPYMLESYDFSFSGLKTAVLYYVKNKSIKINDVYNICASFQETVFDVFNTKLLYVADKLKCKRICVSGGVSANKFLRNKLFLSGRKKGIEFYFPSKNLSTDNAAMIAAASIKFLIN
ncbi:MAG: tRNA (adenosine(37)-N6)-threonylcarbamoyltransferase complex transferase subunit TsaD [Endomicrobia bacterium]|nr:tRNA (adenosine(37)-N6)-threonylcarbamoyltransferase complex transferase subunit TsaD [Endomicrobiia bacterium]